MADKKIKPWHFGNTSVRSVMRLRDGLLALKDSPELQGDLHGKKQERAFRDLLGKAGIVALGNDKSYSVSRKWRAALSQLGFLVPEIPKKALKSGVKQDWVGRSDTFSENGSRLIKANTVPGMQECFLRAMAVYTIPSVLEPEYSFTPFSPLRHTLRVMLALEKQTKDSALSMLEMATIVQMTTAESNVNQIAMDIVILREHRQKARSKRAFDNQVLKKASREFSYVPQTFRDYADCNFRYLKATGLVQSKGKSICLVPEKHVVIRQLVAEGDYPVDAKTYLVALCRGAQLPTDDKRAALEVMHDLAQQLRSRGEQFDVSQLGRRGIADISDARYSLEERLFHLKEIEFAENQRQSWEEISEYLGLLIDRKYIKTLKNGEEISIPKSEAPAYLEWVMWRAFLAINELKNEPDTARGFQIDQDFLPIAPAPGGGADMVFEFDDFVIVVEATLTESSRQEAAEGETVRRHVAKVIEQYGFRGKKVFGLFAANKIDTNTAETFRNGTWYIPNSDRKMRLDIVPLTLTQFRDLFVALFKAHKADNRLLRRLIEKCAHMRSAEAPQWKVEIASIVEAEIASYSI